MGRVPARLGILADHHDTAAGLPCGGDADSDAAAADGQRVVNRVGSSCAGASHRAWTLEGSALHRPQAASLERIAAQ